MPAAGGDHLALAIALEEPRVEGAGGVDGVLPRQCGMRRAHGALSEPWQRYLAATLVLLGRRDDGGVQRRRRGHREAHVAGEGADAGAGVGAETRPASSDAARGVVATAAAPRNTALAARCSLIPLAILRTLPVHYAASVSSFVSEFVYSPKPSTKARLIR